MFTNRVKTIFTKFSFCVSAGKILQRDTLKIGSVSLGVNVGFQRQYRGRPAHNIGRIKGLEKPKPPSVHKKEVGLWKPEKYQATKSNHFGALNFIISGYDLVLVEQFSKFTHQLMIKNKQNVIEVYALPSSDTVIKKMIHAHQRSLQAMEPDITLTTHKRVIQVKDIPSNKYPILLQTLMHYVPQSVTYTVEEHAENHHLERYQYRVELATEREELQRLLDSK